MKIKNAQAGLILRDVVVTELSLKNQLASPGKLDPTAHMLDMDYNVIDVDDSRENSLRAKLELVTKIVIKDQNVTVLNLKVKHLGILMAPRRAFQNTDEFVKAVELNGLASLVSYARATISSITGVIFSQGNLVIPMINIYKLQELKEASTKPD